MDINFVHIILCTFYQPSIHVGHWKLFGVSLPWVAVRRKDGTLHHDPLLQRDNPQPGKGQSLAVNGGQWDHPGVVRRRGEGPRLVPGAV